MKYTATVKVGDKTFVGKSTAGSALEAKNKIAKATLTRFPGKDIYVSDIRLSESDSMNFLKQIFKF